MGTPRTNGAVGMAMPFTGSASLASVETEVPSLKTFCHFLEVE